IPDNSAACLAVRARIPSKANAKAKFPLNAIPIKIILISITVKDVPNNNPENPLIAHAPIMTTIKRWDGYLPAITGTKKLAGRPIIYVNNDNQHALIILTPYTCKISGSQDIVT